ncbi:DUF5789 family protein [Haladaptatus caseinilyticus]|uniref:DUF5789 family protein n=1 Tax=Haladaptatus caseinilyticus TaxID=2993314 RepID=UPI00224AFD10|nr:hypothetical protein [Haladaptatus caseinilyticus]
MTRGEREQGIDYGPLDEELKQHDYPTSADDLVDEYGEYEIDHQNGTETLKAVFSPLVESENQEFDSADEVRQMILNMIGSEAVGREGYSDRGSEQVDNDQESL